jgi:hypothetical protein
LKGNRASDGIDDAGELQEQTVAGGVGDTSAMLLDQRVDEILTTSPKSA